MMTQRWNHLNSKLKTLLAALGVLLMLAALLLCLNWGRQAADNQLFTRVHPRALGAREQDPQAAALPLVGVLWEKHLYYDGSAFEYKGLPSPRYKQHTEPAEYYYQLLYSIGALPDPAARQTQGIEIYGQELAKDFMWLEDILLYQDTVVSASLTLPQSAELDLDTACRSYVAYLGLAELGDWQPAKVFEARGMDSAALYSSKSQLMVQLVVDHRLTDGVGYYLSVTPLYRDIFAQQNIA